MRRCVFTRKTRIEVTALFDIQDIIQALDLHLVYSRIGWTAPPNRPGLLMYLHNQGEFLTGIAYVSTETDAVGFFGTRCPPAFSGSILMVSDWKEGTEKKVTFPEKLSVFCFSDSFGAVFNRMSEYLQRPFEMETSRQFSRYWSEIISNDNLTTDDIRSMLRQLPGAVGPFVQMCVVEFADSGSRIIPYTLIMRHLLALLPHSFGVVRDNEIIILITYRERRFDYPYDREQLNKILEYNNAYMGLGNGTRDLSALNLLFKLLRHTVKLAMQLKVGQETRVFTFERLGMYLTIDLAAIGFKAFTGSDGIMYLAHPAVIFLTRYDEEKHSNLRAVLYFYLLSDKSITETAQRLHIHRNTVMNKIKKACDLCNLDLEDNHLCERLLFSCQLAKYYEEINRSKKILPHILPTDVEDP